MNDSVYGIDLGTTYSAIARISPLGAAEIIPNFEGEQTTPSVVYFESPSTAVVGSEAKRVAITDPDNASLLIKRHMGTDYPQDFQGETYTPEAISALILKELVTAANQESGGEASKVVITVPAYFGVQEREATRQAGAIAGLEVIGIVTEPVAAALSLGIGAGKAETIMVYDLGGGTFDTTVMRVNSGKVEVVAVDGNRKLGGADWDSALVDLIVEKFVAQADLGEDDPRYDEEFMLDLRLGAEETKKSLTKRETATIRCSYDGKKANIEVTRTEFEAATQHLVNQTIEISSRTLEAAMEKQVGLLIDRVLLVGGSSRMPMISAALTGRLGWDPQPTDFDLAVAKGAAIYGQSAVDEVLLSEGQEAMSADAAPRPFLAGATSLTIENVLARGLGVKFARDISDDIGYISFFASANDSIPTTPDPIGASTLSEGQRSVDIAIYEQGGERESELPSDNRELKTAVLPLPAGLPKGSPIDITVTITGEGIVKMIVTDEVSKEQVELEAMVSVLSQEQVDEETVKVTALTLRS